MSVNQKAFNDVVVVTTFAVRSFVCLLSNKAPMFTWLLQFCSFFVLEMYQLGVNFGQRDVYC